MVWEENIMIWKLKLKDSELKFPLLKQKLKPTDKTLLLFKWELITKEQEFVNQNLITWTKWLQLLKEWFQLSNQKLIDTIIIAMEKEFKRSKLEVLLFTSFKAKDSEIISKLNMELMLEFQTSEVMLNLGELISLERLGLKSMDILSMRVHLEEKDLILLVASIVWPHQGQWKAQERFLTLELITLELRWKMDLHPDLLWDHAQGLNQPQNYQQLDKTSHM